jgi:hypothetical protein
MPALKKQDWELFARARAQGANRTKAAEQAGYSVKRSSSQGCVLDKRPEIIARVKELLALKADLIESHERRILDVAGINKESILMGIVEGIDLARAQKKPSDIFKGYELLGKHLRLWGDKSEDSLPWDGDLSKLTEEQLGQMMKFFESLADPAVIAQVRRAALLEAGEVVDVEPEPSKGDGW